MDWTIILALGSLAVSGFAILSRALDKSLSIREHEEFRNNVTRMFGDIGAQMRRDDDRLEDRIKVLEATRPTTGELEARLGKKD